MRHHSAFALCCLLLGTSGASTSAGAKSMAKTPIAPPAPSWLIVEETNSGFVIRASCDGFPCVVEPVSTATRLGSNVRFDPRIAPPLPAVLNPEEASNASLR
jgi:hypothetical protein